MNESTTPSGRGGRSARPPYNISPAPHEGTGGGGDGGYRFRPVPRSRVPWTAACHPGGGPPAGTQHASPPSRRTVRSLRCAGTADMKAKRPVAERNRDAAAKRSGSAQVTSCRANSFPGSGFRRPCPARPYGGFDTTRSNEPGRIPGISPRKSPGTADSRASGQLSRKFRRAKSSRSSWRSTPVPETIPGARRDRSNSRTPHPVPRSRTVPRQSGAANPARITESIEKRYPRSGCRMTRPITKCSPS